MTSPAPSGTTYGRSRPAGRTVLLRLLVPLLVAAGATAALVRPSPVTPARTFVAGVAVGGLGGERLRAAVDGPVRTRVEAMLRITAGAVRLDVRPADLGIRLDVDATVAAVGASRLRLPVRPERRDVPPVVTVDEIRARTVLDDWSRPIRRAARDRSVELRAPEVVLDGKLDASYAPSGRGVDTDPGEPGRTVDTGAAVRAITEAVRSGNTSVRLDVTAVAPADRTPELAGVDQLIGTFTTYHPCCAPRVTNIHRIAALIDGTVVEPGAVFSLNDAAGERTAARGFVAAPAIVDGELEDQIGGGVAQFSTTLFNAAWFAGLDIVTHQPHSLYISRYPPGREATLDWRAIDQKIRNDTAAPLVIRTATTGTSLTVGIYGHTGDREVTSVTGPRRPRGAGFAVEVRRTVRDDGAVTGTDTLRWTYAGLD